MKKKIAFITGVTGQDGSYLAELLLKKNYIVHGLKRRSSVFNTQRIDHIYVDPHQKTNFFMHYGDVMDANCIINLFRNIKPDEVYNLAAQSHVQISFELPEYTSQVNAIGTLKILEAIRSLGLKKTKFYQASSSELFGKIQSKKQTEKTQFYPRSPYAVSKLYAYWITKNYREAHNIFASNGILFNHESERRGETFVTRKITMTLSKIAHGIEKCLYLGNIYSLRDWGHAEDYAEMQWRILQHKKSDDFVVSTGKQYSVKFFVEKCCSYLEIKLKWSGKGLKEVGIIQDFNLKKTPSLKKGMKIIKIDKKYFRPLDVDNLIGDAKKAEKILKWKPKTNINQLIERMMKSDLVYVKKSNMQL